MKPRNLLDYDINHALFAKHIFSDGYNEAFTAWLSDISITIQYPSVTAEVELFNAYDPEYYFGG